MHQATIVYYVCIKSEEASSGIYPSFAESYFGACEKWFNSKPEAQAYLDTFEDWEQTMLEIAEYDTTVEIPF